MNLINLAQEIGIIPQKVAGTNGGEYAASCPRCGGKDRFRIWPNEKKKNCVGSYWCRQCEIRGDSIQFCIDFFGLDFKEAAEKANATIPTKHSFFNSRATIQHVFTPVEIKPPPTKWIEKASSVIAKAHEQIWQETEILDYLKQRGLPEEVVKKCKIGWIPKDIFYDRIDWGLEEIEGKKNKLWIPRGILIPGFDPPNSDENVAKLEDVVRAKVRRTEWKKGDKRGKYIIISGSMNGLSIIGNTDMEVMVVVESELDAYAVHHATKDFAFAVAVGSVQNNPDHATDYLAKTKKHLLISYDNDDDGTGKKLFEKWKMLYPHAKPYPTPIGKDIGEAIKQGFDIRSWLLKFNPVKERSRYDDDKLLIDRLYKLDEDDFYPPWCDAIAKYKQKIPMQAHTSPVLTNRLRYGLKKMLDFFDLVEREKATNTKTDNMNFEWSKSVSSLINWFEKNEKFLPMQAFNLSEYEKVTDAKRFYSRIKHDINSEPNKFRTQFLQNKLEKLKILVENAR